MIYLGALISAIIYFSISKGGFMMYVGIGLAAILAGYFAYLILSLDL